VSIYDFMQKIFLTWKSPVIVEIGAHIGEDTEHLLSFLENPLYYAFEPEQSCAAEFRRKGLHEIVRFTQAAVCDTDGERLLFISDNGKPFPESSSLRKPTGHLTVFPETDFKSMQKVKTVTLDGFFQLKPPTVNFLWCDAQGSEYDIICGAQITLSKTRYIYMEYSDVELYEGQKKLGSFFDILPGKWKILSRDGVMGNILLERIYAD